MQEMIKDTCKTEFSHCCNVGLSISGDTVSFKVLFLCSVFASPKPFAASHFRDTKEPCW